MIKNKINNKIYIGQSLDIKDRFRRHKYNLKKGNHGNIYLYKSYLKYGIDSFEFKIIYQIKNIISKEEIIKILNEKEKVLIKFYNSFNNGYNLTSGGNNMIFGEESKKRMSDSHKGIMPSLKCRETTSKRMKGKKFSDELKNKISIGIKESWRNRKNRKLNRKPGYKIGPASEERKRKIGEAQLGNKNHNFGKITPEYVKQKCRDSYHGSQCHLAKLNDDQVKEIKIALLNGEKGVTLAKKYKVAQTQISSIKKGKTWKHVII